MVKGFWEIITHVCWNVLKSEDSSMHCECQCCSRSWRQPWAWSPGSLLQGSQRLFGDHFHILKVIRGSSENAHWSASPQNAVGGRQEKTKEEEAVRILLDTTDALPHRQGFILDYAQVWILKRFIPPKTWTLSAACCFLAHKTLPFVSAGFLKKQEQALRWQNLLYKVTLSDWILSTMLYWSTNFLIQVTVILKISELLSRAFW